MYAAQHEQKVNHTGGIYLGKLKEKLAVWARDRSLVRVAMGIGSAFLLLLVCLCITVFMHSHIHQRYTTAADQMQEQAYQELIGMTELFARIDDPEVDVQNKLIPELKAKYLSVSALNTALTEGFGADSAVLTDEQTAAFNTAFEEYSSAYRQGLATGLAQADMTACIQQVQAMIEKRYPPDVEPTEPVVIIDGSSGEIARP